MRGALRYRPPRINGESLSVATDAYFERRWRAIGVTDEGRSHEHDHGAEQNARQTHRADRLV